jgi:hypothetical protein
VCFEALCPSLRHAAHHAEVERLRAHHPLADARLLDFAKQRVASKHLGSSRSNSPSPDTPPKACRCPKAGRVSPSVCWASFADLLVENFGKEPHGFSGP